MLENLLTNNSRIHAVYPALAAMLTLAACSSKKAEDPKPIIDPVVYTFQLDWEAAMHYGNPPTDTTYFLYNDNGTLNRITRALKAEHGDTSKYINRFIYEGDALKQIITKGERNGINMILSHANLIYSGNALTVNYIHSTGNPNSIPFKYIFENGRPQYLGDTSFTGYFPFTRCIWNGSNLKEERTYYWGGDSGRDTLLNYTTLHTYVEGKENPYFHSGIALQHWLSFVSNTNRNTFSSGLIQKTVEIGRNNQPNYTSEYTYEYNAQGYPVKCHVKYTKHTLPGSPSFSYTILYGYRKQK